jgi:hypothetical protein
MQMAELEAGARQISRLIWIYARCSEKALIVKSKKGIDNIQDKVDRLCEL